MVDPETHKKPLQRPVVRDGMASPAGLAGIAQVIMEVRIDGIGNVRIEIGPVTGGIIGQVITAIHDDPIGIADVVMEIPGLNYGRIH